MGIVWSGRRVEGIVFDIDGTLTDSIEAYYEGFREVMANIGIQIKREDILEPMATGSLIWDRVIPENTPGRDEKIRQCMELIPQIYQEVFKSVQPFPGLESVLIRLEEKGVCLGVLTASRGIAVQPLHHSSLIRYFRVIMTRDEGFPNKPAPNGILECLKRMEISPNQAITIGDTPLDIRAGKAAGTLTIGVLSGIGSRPQLQAEEPTAIIGGVSDLLSLFDLE